MKKITTRLGLLAAASLFLAACGLVQIPVSLPVGDWFAASGASGISESTGADGVYENTSSVDVPTGDLEQFSRGGITLSSVGIDGGSVSATAALSAAQASTPATLEVVVYVKDGAFTDFPAGGTQLISVDIPIDADLNLDTSGTFSVDSSTFDDAIDIVKSSSNLYAGVTVKVLDSDGTVLPNYDFELNGLQLNLSVSPL